MTIFNTDSIIILQWLITISEAVMLILLTLDLILLEVEDVKGISEMISFNKKRYAGIFLLILTNPFLYSIIEWKLVMCCISFCLCFVLFLMIQNHVNKIENINNKD